MRRVDEGKDVGLTPGGLTGGKRVLRKEQADPLRRAPATGRLQQQRTVRSQQRA
jgi:hypothetical protein